MVGKARKSQEGFGVLEDKIQDIILDLFPGPVPKLTLLKIRSQDKNQPQSQQRGGKGPPGISLT